MEVAVSAARLVVSTALAPITDGLLEPWLASSKLGTNVRELKLELLYAQGMLTSAQDRRDVNDISNLALEQLLLELRHLAYAADDLLDELDYFRIQDELDGTYETIDDDEEEPGSLVRGLVLHARHTARVVAGKLTCSCGTSSRSDHGDQQEVDAKQGRCISATSAVVGKCLPCCSLPSVEHDPGAGTTVSERCFICGAWSSKPQRKIDVVHAPKLKFRRVEMSNKIAHVVEQLKPVCAKVATFLGLESTGHNNNAKTKGVDWERRTKTNPEIIEPELYGRQRQKGQLVDEIIHGKYDDNDLTVLPIVGPGGIGKTTFTQHIYDKVRSHFQVPVWQCIGQNFNADKLAQEILNQIPKSKDEKDRQSVQEKIKKRIQSKMVLLVLDDMWTYHEDAWKTLLAPFRKGGTKGNMVIVTTRIPKVAEMVKLMSCPIKLEHLQDEDSMQLFQACVGIKTWKDDQSKLFEEVGRDIVKRLKGSPLAIKTVGRLLRNQPSLNRWRTILKSKEWELQTNDDDIMPALRLSYNYLPYHLQQCFSCCALFPEDYRFGRQELIHLWIGLGLLGAGNPNKRIEDTGLSYLDELVDNGFFERDRQNYDSPNYAIHDLLHDLATAVSSYEYLRLNSSDVRFIQIPTSIRHMSVIVDNTHVKNRKAFENHKNDLSTLSKKLKARNLRTFMLFGEYHGSFYKIFADILRHIKSLRVVSLSGASYNVKDLFHNFSELVHLRYLRIKDSRFHVASLPSNITRFYHLLVLDLQDHHGQLGFLRDMRNLLKLRHFLVNDDNMHSSIFEVGKLQSLQELRRFEVKRETEGFELAQIGQLIELQGSLGIYNLEKVEAIKEADEGKLAHINNLDGLILNWDNGQCIKNSTREGKILESLKPHDNLRKLEIVGHGGATCPNWLSTNLSIKNLESLHLKGVNWNILPLLEKLCMPKGEELQGSVQGQGFHCLKTLKLARIPTLEKWFGNGNCNLVPCLQNLSISDFPNLVELPFSDSSSYQSEQSMISFPKLETIDILDCPKLLSFPPIPWTRSLCQVHIKGVSSGFDELYYGKDEQLESRLIIKRKDDWDGVFWDLLEFSNLTELQNLEIENFPHVSLNHLKMLTCLKSLKIKGSSNILLPVGGENNAQYKLPVEDLTISSCGANGRELIQLLSHFPKLSKLKIKGCQNIAQHGVTVQQTTRSNKAAGTLTGRPQQQATGAEEEEIVEAAAGGDEEWLLLHGSDSLDSGGTAASVGFQGLLSLQSLDIEDCPNLIRSSCPPFPTSLRSLHLCGVEGMETLPPSLPNLTELRIDRCGNLRGGEVLWALLAKCQPTFVLVTETPNFFLGLEHYSKTPNLHVDVQEDIDHSSILQLDLRTDDFAGFLAAPICRLLSSSLANLWLLGNHEVECFTREQEEALHMLTSIQHLLILHWDKLQSLPHGLDRLPGLRTIQIVFCPAIRSLDGLPDSLQELEIVKCTAISSLDGLPDSLQVLGIYGCPAIHSLPKDGLPTSLREIKVQYCGSDELKMQCGKLLGTIPIVWTTG
uniref:AAA+ ATPase domain-containing protein n=1 Tax=Leersia perrieri TaxID=77586 RepID=A0A0D9XZB9_9ORYZ